MPEPDYSEWMSHDLWTLIEAACLLSGREPVEWNAFKGLNGPAKRIYRQLKDANLLGTLTYWESLDGTAHHRRVKPDACVTWAAGRGYAIPTGLSALKADAERAPPSPTPSTRQSVPRQAAWNETAREYATEIYKRNREAGATPSKTDLAKEIADRFRKEHIEGARGPLDEQTIRRHALNTWSAPSDA